MDNQILLIEDEEYIRDLYKRQLELGGFIVNAFGTGQEGLEAFKKNTYQLVLLDIMLPDMNGIEILRHMKEIKDKQDVKVVLLTNLGQDNIIKEAFELGALGYLIKLSINPYQLIDEVKNFMSSDS